MRDCPFCKGSGSESSLRRRRDLGLPPHPDGDTVLDAPCDACAGTGEYGTAKLIRAARLGEEAGLLRAVARINGDPFGVPLLSWQTISTAVVDDMRLQRVKEALDPESLEIRKLRDEVAQLRREREPVLAAFAAFEAELDERIATEVPR